MENRRGPRDGATVIATLSALAFSDIYVRIDKATPLGFPSRYHPVERKSGPKANIEVPREFDDDIEELRPRLRAPAKDDFSIDHDGIRLRAR